MDQFSKFSAEKQKVLDQLGGLQEILEAIQGLGVDTVADVAKVGHARISIESDELRIALLGAFSDGKTSVVAAWLGKVLADMKIDMDESSDRLVSYRPDGLPARCEIVDTPGLFGDKEINAPGKAVMYEDLTKRYISEAHLILYVVDATNPLKDSHTDIVKWLLRDLGKLSATLFVINKMDEVCDLKDPVSFQQQTEIKQKNLAQKLERAASLRPEEVSQLKMVCVAANPNGRGLNFWFEKAVEFESRSRISQLKAATLAVLGASVLDVLQAKTGMDVVQELVGAKVEALAEHQRRLSDGKAQMAQEIERVEEDLETGLRNMGRNAKELSSELDALEAELTAKLRPLELHDLQVFLEDEIGLVENAVGAKLQRRIKSLVESYALRSAEVVNKVKADIARQIEITGSFLESYGAPASSVATKGLKSVQGMDPKIIQETILAGRELLKGLGMTIKFKPWEVKKLAGNLGKWAGALGGLLEIGTDIYTHVKRAEREQTLREAKQQLGQDIQASIEDVRSRLANDPGFLSPQLTEFEKILATLRVELEKLDAGRSAALALEARLRTLAVA